MKSNHTKVIAVANQKGGVGKTKTTNVVARDLATKGYNILLIDFDPQMTLTKQFSINPDDIKNTPQDISIIFTDNAFPQPKQVPIDQNKSFFLDMLFASETLTESSQSGVSARELRLKNYLKKVKNESKYDYILIDTGGSLGVLFTNAILSSDTIILPIQTAYEALDSTKDFFREVAKLENQFDHIVKDIIFFGNMYNGGALHDREQLKAINIDIPIYIAAQKEIGNHVDLSIHIVKEVPQRTAIKDAAGNKMYLREYIKTYVKSNENIFQTYNEIFKILTSKNFTDETKGA